MSVLRFVGVTSREAMRKVREALGDDALIIANRRVDDGVEVLAMADESVPQASGAATASPEATGGAAPRALPPRQRESGWALRRQEDSRQPAPQPTPAPSTSMDAASERLLQEIQGMRSLLVREQALRDGATDGAGRLWRLLTGAGFSEPLAQQLLQELPPAMAGPDGDEEALRDWAVRQLAGRMDLLDAEDAFFVQGGVIALVGPTGVGKTTSTAKIAARFVMRHGPEQVALLSTDSFRIGAHEQLRIYAELLNVPLYALDAEQPITRVLEELRGKKLVLIDTVGTSQRDQRVIEQIARLQAGSSRLRMVLVLNGAAQPDTLDEVIASYSAAAQAAGGRLQDCMLTKHDETGRLAPVLDRIIQQGLRLLFVSHGQRVPEDLALADGPGLISQSLEAAPQTPAPTSARRPAAAATGSGWPRQLLSQGRRVGATLRLLEATVPGFRELLQAWDLTALPEAHQLEGAAGLLDRVPHELGHEVSGMLWQRRTPVTGVDAPMPDLWLDERGDWIAWPALQHRQPAGQAERLRWATVDGGANVHLLPALPDAMAWDWLLRQGFPWICQVRGSLRVELDDARVTMSSLEPHTEAVARVQCQFRNQPAELALSRVAVLAAPQGRGRTPQRFAVRAWVGRLRSRETGAELGQRYWLTPRAMAGNAATLLRTQLAVEALPRLARRLQQKLAEVVPEQARPELRWQLAAGLAAAASRIVAQDSETGMNLRAELLNVLGARAGATPNRLADALLYLCSARDTLRVLAASGEGGGQP